MKTEGRIPMAERRPKAEIRKPACFRLRLASARQVAEAFPVRASVFGSRILKSETPLPAFTWLRRGKASSPANF